MGVGVSRLGDPILRAQCRPVSDPAGNQAVAVADKLKSTLYSVRRDLGFGRGIAAPQVGSDLQIVFVCIDEPMILINPRIEERSPAMFELWDDCLSLPPLLVRVRRHRAITVRYRDLAGRPVVLRAEDELSELLQHEIDHLHGTLILDRAHGDNAIWLREEWERRAQGNDG